jgi:hypothetical protein
LIGQFSLCAVICISAKNRAFTLQYCPLLQGKCIK